MKTTRPSCLGLLVLAHFVAASLAVAADKTPHIQSLEPSGPAEMTIIFHAGTGPFRIETKHSLAAGSPWADVPDANVLQLEPGVFLTRVAKGPQNLALYRVVSENDGISELNGWTVLARVSRPSNGVYFVPGERPEIIVSLLDSLPFGLTPYDFATLNLYMYGPQAPAQTVTASRLLNASTNRAARPHHYVDLKNDGNALVSAKTITYRLQPITDEAPGTYRVSIWAVMASDPLQQIMKFADLQIGTSNVEQPLVAKTKCANCHEGTVSGRTYLHHIDPSGAPGSLGNWALDYQPVASCKSCHNNEGYAAYSDTNAPGGRVPDPIIRRVHGVHMGEHLRLPFNTNEVNGDFRHYRHVLFPADVRNCTSCHVDDRWKTNPTRQVCTTCHDNTWFGPVGSTPAGMEPHPGGAWPSDVYCANCHMPDGGVYSVSEVHKVPTPAMNEVALNLTPPANGLYYTPGESPLLTVVFKDDAGLPIDHTKVTDVNFSTAALFVYGPRSHAVPVLTSTAKNVNSRLRASVSNNKDGPWAINKKLFRISINGSAPQDITIAGASDLVTPAEVVASLNPVITNLNGGAKASVSGARVNIKTLIEGASARIAIYNGEVTAAMVWKRGPNTVLEPDVTVAAASMPANDLRLLSDPLDYKDPKVTRTPANITYQLDDVSALAAGTYNIYVYHLPKAGKIGGLAAPTGVGDLMFQVKTGSAEKKIATNCTQCHGSTIWHFYEGPIHAEPFDTDYCTACHDYSHTGTGDLFKNHGGTSLNGWSGFGAMPIARRVHAVHYAHYLQHPEEIYANATVETFGNIIFPQDVRNCTKCHAQSDTWKQKPSRVACLACHDSDAAKAHGALMTSISDPSDPYGPGAVEACDVCHGVGSAYSADKVHSISKPYVPPYPRERAE